MTTSNLGLDLIKHFEGLHDGDLTKIGLQPKMCPAGIWTVGWGHALIDPVSHKFLRGDADKSKAYAMYPALTLAQADAFLADDVKKFERMVNDLRLTLSQAQFDAIVSFIYNCGLSNFEKSTLLRRIKAKASVSDIEKAFLMWNKADGKVLPGLTLRRQCEALLFNTGKLNF
jgi:lysozyme